MTVLVTGMHRSGTSALAQFLLAGGLHPGRVDWLMPPADSNSRGHFELTPIVDLNDRLLAELSAHWLAPPAAEPSFRERRFDALHQDARAERFDGSCHFLCSGWVWFVFRFGLNPRNAARGKGKPGIGLIPG